MRFESPPEKMGDGPYSDLHGERLARSLAACCLAEITKLDPTDSLLFLLPKGLNLGIEAIHWESNTQKLFFIDSRFYEDSEKLSSLLRKAIDSIRALNLGNLELFPESIRPYLSSILAQIPPSNSFWILVVNSPLELPDESKKETLQKIKSEMLKDGVVNFEVLENGWKEIYGWLKLHPPSTIPPVKSQTKNYSWEEVQKINAARKEAMAVENLLHETNTPPTDYPMGSEEWPAVDFQMANGNDVKIAVDWFPEILSSEDQKKKVNPDFYYAIRVFSTEETLPRSLEFYWEFHPEFEFPFYIMPKIWDWLQSLVQTRHCLEYDWTDEFLEDFERTIAEFSAVPNNAVEHYDRLPELTNPEAFDHDVDDSLNNDQNEPDRREP